MSDNYKKCENEWYIYYINFINFINDKNNYCNQKQNKDINWDSISKNPNINKNILTDYYYLPWNLNRVSNNPNFGFNELKEVSLLLENKKKNYIHNWSIIMYITNSNFDPKNFFTDRDKLFNFFKLDKENLFDYTYEYYLSHNPNLTWDTIKKYPSFSWNISSISSLKYITLDIIENNPEIEWVYYKLSKNPNLNLDFIIKNINKNWDWYEILKHPNFNYNDIIKLMKYKNIDFEDWVFICQNPNLTWENILSFKPENRIFYELSRHPAVTWEIYKSYPEFEWDIKTLSMNPNITINIIEKNKDIDWNYYFISRNPNLTIDFIKKNINQDWNWESIYKHKLLINKKDWIIDFKNKYIASLKIQRFWRDVNYNPIYQKTRKNIIHFFNENN